MDFLLRTDSLVYFMNYGGSLFRIILNTVDRQCIKNYLTSSETILLLIIYFYIQLYYYSKLTSTCSLDFISKMNCDHLYRHEMGIVHGYTKFLD